MKLYSILIALAILTITVFASSGISQITFNSTAVNFSQTRMNVTIGTYEYAHYSGVDVRHISVLVSLMNGSAGNTTISIDNFASLFANGIAITSNSTNLSSMPPFSQELGIQISNFTPPGNYALILSASGADPSANATLNITVPIWKHTQMITVTTLLPNTTTTEQQPSTQQPLPLSYLVVVVIILIIIAVLGRLIKRNRY